MSNIVQFWRSWSGVERSSGLAVGLVAAGALAWVCVLWRSWGENPDLSHGYLALPALALLWQRARENVAAGPGLSAGWVGCGVGLALAGLAGAILFTTVYAVALGWGAAPTLFFLSAALASALGVAAILAAGREVRWVVPGWPLWVMLAVVLLSAPLPPGTYARMTAGLQEGIAVGVVETLRLFGVPALLSGNVIQLGAVAVGVEEACSGVRSLLSCVLAGLVLSALMLDSPWRRFWLASLAVPLALAANFGRSLTLTLLAKNGVRIEGAWHDGLGYAVLVLTTVALAALASWLEDKPIKTEGRGERADPATVVRWAGFTAVVALVLAAGWFGFIGMRSGTGAGRAGNVPVLARLVPEMVPEGWRVQTRKDLGRFAGILQTEHLIERTYSKITDAGEVRQITVYVAWWPAGGASVSTVAAHTPEACWPGAGWTVVPSGTERGDLEMANGTRIGEAEKRTFMNREFPQNVWFWHLVDGRPMRAFDPRSWREQLRMFFERGVRRDAEQAFVRLSSNAGWAQLAADPLIAEVISGVAQLGVPVTVP